MAVPRSTSLLFRFLCFAGVMALALGLSATSGQARSRAGVTAAPATSQQALAQLRTFNRQLEKVTEQYNEARVLLGKRTARARAATARARAAAKTVAAHQARIRRLVQAENRADRPGTAGSGQSSRPPGRFAGKVRVTDTIATRHASVLAKARRASAAAAKAARQARAAVAAAAKLARQLAAKRRDLGRRAAQSKAMFDRLSAAERRALAGNAVAAPGGTARARGPAAVAVRWARRQVGKPYVWGAAGPGSFDCSGLTSYVWAKAGVTLPHSSRMQYTSSRRVSRSQLRPGDLVYFGSPVYHVAIYVGDNTMITAPQPGDVVKYQSLDAFSDYTGATRPG